MEIVTLATMALTLAKPFIQKIGEGTSRKIGEDIWNLMKEPFIKSGKEIEALSTEEIKEELVVFLGNDKDFKEEIEKFVLNNQNNTFQQSINNNGNIEKQVNIGSVNGNINL